MYLINRRPARVLEGQTRSQWAVTWEFIGERFAMFQEARIRCAQLNSLFPAFEHVVTWVEDSDRNRARYKANPIYRSPKRVPS